MTIKLSKKVIEFLEDGYIRYDNNVKSYITARGTFQETEKEGVYEILPSEFIYKEDIFMSTRLVSRRLKEILNWSDRLGSDERGEILEIIEEIDKIENKTN